MMDKEQTSTAAALAALASGITMCFLGFFMSPKFGRTKKMQVDLRCEVEFLELTLRYSG